MEKRRFFDELQDDIMNLDIPEKEKNETLKKIMWAKEQQLNVLITGATGSGKSSTINALFGTEVAKVGVGVDPETMEIEKYEFENMTLWDTPGLGDGEEADKRHAQNIIKKLSETDKDGNALIDLVLVILNGSSPKDFGTSFRLINNIIIPNLGNERKDRILVAPNQADMLNKGRDWDYEKNEPNERLKDQLENWAKSTQKRIKESTGVDVEPVYYCAGYMEEGGVQERPYNLSKLLYYIVKATPSEKRLHYVDSINQDANMWQDSDEKQDYREETRMSFAKSVIDLTSICGDIGEAIGGLFGKNGEKIGRAVGTVVGGALTVIGSLFF